LLRAAEVVTRREMLAGASQDDDAHLVIVDGRRKSVVEFFEQNAALGVQDLRPIGRDLEHRAGALGEQGGIGHVSSRRASRTSLARAVSLLTGRRVQSRPTFMSAKMPAGSSWKCRKAVPPR